MPDFTVRIVEFDKKQWIVDETKIRELITWLNENGEQQYDVYVGNFFTNLLRTILRGGR